jgi:hypothetical protein
MAMIGAKLCDFAFSRGMFHIQHIRLTFVSTRWNRFSLSQLSSQLISLALFYLPAPLSRFRTLLIITCSIWLSKTNHVSNIQYSCARHRKVRVSLAPYVYHSVLSMTFHSFPSPCPVNLPIICSSLSPLQFRHSLPIFLYSTHS